MSVPGKFSKVEPDDMPRGGYPMSAKRPRDDPPSQLRLYIARSTPNSVRAEFSLSVVLDEIRGECASPALEIIDVFSQPRRAITDGVIVTPTLLGLSASKRIVLMGDLADQVQLKRVLHDLLGPARETTA